jgi:hypothetical protein
VQEISDCGIAILRARELGDVGRRCVINRLDCTFRDCNANQHRRDRFGHRMREETMAVGARVLIVLEEDGVILGYQ